jgi:hypothetical protein
LLDERINLRSVPLGDRVGQRADGISRRLGQILILIILILLLLL